MPFSAILFACAVACLSFVSASPLSTRQSSSAFCSPNFEGTGISVTNSAREWGILNPVGVDSDVTSYSPRGLLNEADFRFEQTGQPATSYIIKPIDHNELAVAVRQDGTLEVAAIDAHDPTQIWDVSCDFCGTNAASFHGQFSFGCNITSTPTGQCVQIGAQATDALFLAPCNGKDSQNFDFWTVFN